MKSVAAVLALLWWVSAPAVASEIHATSLPDLATQLQGWLQQSFEGSGQAVQLEPQGSWGLKAAWLPKVHVAVKAQTVIPGGWSVALSVVPAEPLGAGVQPSEVRFRVLELKPVWVVRTAVRKGDALSCAQLEQGMRTRKSDVQAPWAGPCAALTDAQARRPLQPGSVLMDRDIGQATAVRDQQQATVIARLGNIQIQGSGTVMSDAQVGQQVAIKMNGQKALIQAVVTAPGQVQVMEIVR